MKSKIFVSYHRPSLIIKSDVIWPIQSGKEVSGFILNDMIGGNTGYNISYKL